MKLWVKAGIGAKFLVVRRDGTIPKWPWFVLGARDPAAPAGLRAYAMAARKLGMDLEYCDSVVELARDYEMYNAMNGNGDPDAPPHRHDDYSVAQAMAGHNLPIFVTHDGQGPVGQ